MVKFEKNKLVHWVTDYYPPQLVVMLDINNLGLIEFSFVNKQLNFSFDPPFYGRQEDFQENFYKTDFVIDKLKIIDNA